MKIAIRADAAVRMGGGHVIRCLTLADELTRHGADVQFICRAHEGHLASLIEERGYAVSLLPVDTGYKAPASPDHARWIGADWQRDAEQTQNMLNTKPVDWLVVDHYGLDARWHSSMRPYCERILVIDDLADRQLDADLLLDQTYYTNLNTRYDSLIPPGTVTLLGPRFSLLRKEFIRLHSESRVRQQVNRILVFYSSTDPVNETYKAVSALRSFPQFEIDIVIGRTSEHKQALANICQSSTHMKLHMDIDYMAELIAKADLAFGALGGASWERAILGVPTAVTSLAEHQVRAAKDLAQTGAVWYLGNHDSTTIATYEEFLNNICGNETALKQASEACFKLFGEEGQHYGAEAVVENMLAFTLGEQNKSSTT